MKKNKYFLLAIVFILLPKWIFPESIIAGETTYFSNALFNALLAVIILLAIIIIALSQVIKNVADSDLLNERIKENNGVLNKKGLLLIFGLFLSHELFSQSQNSSNSWAVGGIDPFTFYFLLSIIFVECLVLGLLFYQFRFLLQKTQKKSDDKVVAPKKDLFEGFLTDAVPLEEEESVLMDHEYDGIRELDNNLPPWWKYGFYLTIIFSVIYIYRYHFSESGKLQLDEYNTEMAKAKADIEEYMKNASNMVDETSVTRLEKKEDLEAGKELYINACAACHGKLGEGGVGPNLTDEYWIHGGSIQDIFKSIKYGWPEKGMKSWKEDYSPMQISQLTSYVLSIAGSNPPNAKAPQGDVFRENQTTGVSDSTATFSKDSIR